MKVIALAIVSVLLATVSLAHSKDQSKLLPNLVSAGNVTQQSVVL